jgi:hypothetical protein
MKRHFLHLKYQIWHKINVFIECCRLGIVFRGIFHDWSKFLPSEWFGYADYYYGPQPPSDIVQMCFEWSSSLHKKRNGHHWENPKYHPRGQPTRPMSKGAVKEMLADWRATRYKPGGISAGAYYAENRHRIDIAQETAEYFESLMTPSEKKDAGLSS